MTDERLVLSGLFRRILVILRDSRTHEQPKTKGYDDRHVKRVLRYRAKKARKTFIFQGVRIAFSNPWDYTVFKS